MNNNDTQYFHPGDFFVLRSPLLPYKNIEALTIEKLRILYQDPVLQEAIFIASPDLYSAFRIWLSGEMENFKNKDRIELTLVKYLLRMAYRCTPFGIFAGVSVGKFANANIMQLAAREENKKSSRLDMDFLCKLVKTQTQNNNINDQLIYYPNNTIYYVGDDIRYVEYLIDNGKRYHRLVNVESSAYLDSLLQKAKYGAKFSELLTVLVDDEISEEEAKEFIREIIVSQLLVSNTEPVITGKNYLTHLIEVSSKFSENILFHDHLIRTDDLIRQADINFTGEAIHHYQSIIDHIRELDIDFEANQLLQVDMYKPVETLTLTGKVTDTLSEAIMFLAQIKIQQDPAHLQQFRQAFIERYEGCEIPLVEALDADMGLGYPISDSKHDLSPLLEDVVIAGGINQEITFILSSWQKFIFDKYLFAIKNNLSEIEFTEKETISFLKQDSLNKLPFSFYTLCQLLGDQAAINEDSFKLVHKVSTGPSAANFLGRFCHINEDLTHSVKKALQAEQLNYGEKVILAEIVHINQARTGNIASRPILRDYEIPILVQAGVDTEMTIFLQDLKISVKNGKIFLRSEKLGKRIIPRLSSAHNYSSHALPVYHFLCDLMFQDTLTGLAWDWGFLNQADYLPRVNYGKVILSKARWKLSAEQIESLRKIPEVEFNESVKQIFNEKNIPRFFLLSEGDNQIPIDTENPLCLKIFHQFAKANPSIIIEEDLFNHNNLSVSNKEGHYTNEIIIPWMRTADIQTKATLSDNSKLFSPQLQEVEFAGKWLYFKIYCGYKTADKILVQVIKPLAEELLIQKKIDKWFFIRYNDPKPHLRFRLHSKDDLYAIIPLLEERLQPYIKSKLVEKFVIDEYKPETDRYGYNNMTESETLFYYDSKAVVSLINELDGDTGDNYRWLLAIKGIDELLNDFGLNTTEKKVLMNLLQKAFKTEFDAGNINSKKSLADKYRKEKNNIRKVLIENNDEFAPAFQIFNERSINWKPVIENILQKNLSNTLSVSLESLLSSYIHMYANRLIRSRQRMQELVIYDFLFMHYSSIKARDL